MLWRGIAILDKFIVILQFTFSNIRNLSMDTDCWVICIKKKHLSNGLGGAMV